MQDAQHIYWVDGSAIARANLDGSGVDESFISLPGSFISAIAVDSGHVYWVTSTDVIGRANLDGSWVDPSFLSIKPASGPDAPTGLVVHGQFVYWSLLSTDMIGRANVDGSGLDPSFITVQVPGCTPTAVCQDRAGSVSGVVL